MTPSSPFATSNRNSVSASRFRNNVIVGRLGWVESFFGANIFRRGQPQRVDAADKNHPDFLLPSELCDADGCIYIHFAAGVEFCPT